MITRRYEDCDEWAEWTVSGRPGAVTFTAYLKEQTSEREIAACIVIHSRDKRESSPRRGRCDILVPDGRGYCYLKTEHAARTWLLSSHGRKPEIIWEVLESWYRTYFGEEDGG